jgi:predicted dehydrogenase
MSYNDVHRLLRAKTMEKALRIGIIGLGCRWQKRYKRALLGLSTSFTIRAVYDQVQERAAREAKRLRCDAAAGPSQLLEREDVEAVLLLDQQWFGLWPLEQACQLGKPVLCCCSPATDDAHAEALLDQIRKSRLLVMMDLLPRFMMVSEQLRTLFKNSLGAPQLLCCDVVRFGPSEHPSMLEQSPVLDLVGDTGIALLDWCAGLLGGEPLNVMARSLEKGRFSTLFLEFADRRGVQLTRRCHGPEIAGMARLRRRRRTKAAKPWHAAGPGIRLQILAERGSAVVELPSQLSWSTHEVFGYHASHGELSPTQLLLIYFHEVVQGKAALQPTFADAYRVLRWLRVAVRSRDQGRLLPISG